jgi:hypothetical protein
VVLLMMKARFSRWTGSSKKKAASPRWFVEHGLVGDYQIGATAGGLTPNIRGVEADNRDSGSERGRIARLPSIVSTRNATLIVVASGASQEMRDHTVVCCAFERI